MEQSQNQSNLNEKQFTATTPTTSGENTIFKRNKIMNQNENAIETPSCAFEISCSKFESINDDCLREICQYLDIMDVVNIAATCTRLLNFAKEVIFPKKTKHIIVETGLDEIPVTITFPMDNQFSSKITLKSLVTAFRCFGEFVEDLTLEFIEYICFQRVLDVCPMKKTKIWHSYVIVMERCQYLKTFSFKYFDFDLDKTHTLQERIENFRDLNELNLWRCKGITNNWSSRLNTFKNVDKMTLTANNAISGTFFENFKHLSSLTIDFDFCKWRADDLAIICDVISSSLEHLKIMDKDNHFNDYQAIAALITEKLVKLKSLEFHGHLTESSKFLTDLPLVKILHIRSSNMNINSLMQTLSDNGNVEELSICWTIYSNENANAPPLVFNKLRHLHLDWFGNLNSEFFEAITRSHMPAIESFEFGQSDIDEMDYLLKFIESKITLKSICIAINEGAQFDFVLRIIEILHKPSTPARPFLKLKFYEFYLEPEEVSTIESV